MAAAFSDISERWPQWRTPLAVMMLFSYLLTHPHQLGRRYFQDEIHEAMREELARRIPSTDLVVVEDLGHLPYHLYALRRKGWVASRAQLADEQYLAQLRAQGAKWIIQRAASGELALTSL